MKVLKKKTTNYIFFFFSRVWTLTKRPRYFDYLSKKMKRSMNDMYAFCKNLYQSSCAVNKKINTIFVKSFSVDRFTIDLRIVTSTF